MAERVGAAPAGVNSDQAAHDDTVNAAPARSAARPVGQRHCWVVDLPNRPGRRFAGLVVDWQAGPNGEWAARTIYIVDDPGHTVVVEAWVPAGHLQPH